MTEILRRHRLCLKKSLGQNFLIDENILGKVLSALEASPDDCVVEIGPGIGTLTVALAQACRWVLAIELDPGLATVVREHTSGFGNVSVITADAARIDFPSNLRAAGCDATGPRWKVVSNLPYYATSPIIMNVLSCGSLFTRLVFMVQKEVARRIVAAPGDEEYGAFSVACQYWTRPRVYWNVPRTAFMPAPEVDSAIVVMDVRDMPPERVQGPDGEDLFFKVVRAAFGKRRKTLSSALRGTFGREAVDRALKASGIEPSRRAETLSVREFTVLARALGMEFAKGSIQC